MNRSTQSALRTLTCGALLLGLSASAFGQYALDRNLQQGGSGVNPANPTEDFAARNQLIYGNVGGLGFFRDSALPAPGDFRGQLGSDELFRFRAASTPPTNIGMPGQIAPLQGGAPTVVQRSFAAPIEGSQAVRVFDQPAWTNPSIPTGQTFDPRRTGAGFDRPDALQFGGAGLGQFQDADGRLNQIIARPMIGVRTLGPDQRTPLAPGMDRTDDAWADDQLAPAPGMRPGLTPGMAPGMTPGTTPGFPGELTPGRGITDRDRASGEPPAESRRNISLMLGAQLGGELHRDWRIGEVAGRTQDEQLARIQASVLQVQGSRQARPGEDVYMDLLSALQQREAVLAGRAGAVVIPQDSLVRVHEPTDGEAAPAVPGLDAPQLPGLGDIAREPTAEELRLAEQVRIEATRRALGLPPQADPDAEEADADRAVVRPEIERLIEALRHDLAPLGTLAGQRDDRITGLMRQAEQLLSEGRYFDAERAFGGVLTLRPDRPMARVGLVHSQIGAGLLQTAGLNLRRLLADHPELTATRYEARLLPGVPRIEWATQRLREMAANQQGEETGLVLAYIGFQIGQRSLVELGLDVFEAEHPRDPLSPLLRRIWLAEEAEQEP